jgi:DNA-binding CsgD family transcriptional regulator
VNVVTLKSISALIERIYFSVNHPETWEATLAAIAAAVDASGAAVWMSDLDHPEVGMVATTFQDQELLARHNDDYAASSPLFRSLSGRPPGHIYTCEELMPREQFVQTPMYREFWQEAGIEHCMGGFLAREKNRVAVIWVYRQQSVSFTRSEADFLEVLQPHLVQALALRGEMLRTETLAQTGMLALDRMAMAMLLLDEEGRAVAHNSHVETFISQGLLRIEDDGLQLAGAHNSGLLSNLVASTRLGATKAGVLSGGGFKLVPEAGAQAEVEVLVLPYRPAWSQVDSLMSPIVSVVFIKNVGSAPIPREPLLRDLYDLTLAEVRVCVALLDGATVKEIAERQRVSLDAIRYHCKNILRKTGTNRQSDLIRTLSLSLINMGGE